MDTVSANASSLSLTDVVRTAIQLPGVRVNRESFLCEIFKEVDKDNVMLLFTGSSVWWTSRSNNTTCSCNHFSRCFGFNSTGGCTVFCADFNRLPS